MKVLNSVFDLEWSARTVVEASAGTGKTYTIVGIFIRLLIEKELDLDKILVMTFTNKATSELRGRILERLRECVRMLETDSTVHDPFLKEFSDWIKDKNRDEVLNRLKGTIRNFDDSRVFTIHGFCQKVLNEEALLAGVPFDLDIVQNDDLLLQSAEDFWRTFINKHSGNEAGNYYLKKLHRIAKTPAELISNDGIGYLFSQKSAEIEVEIIESPVSYLEDVIQLRRRMRSEWEKNKDEIIPILKNCDIKRYNTHFDGRVEKLEKFLNDDHLTDDTPGCLNYFTSDYLYDSNNLNKDGNPLPKNNFYELCSQYQVLISTINKVESTLIDQAYRDISQRRSELQKSSGTMTYDDLLISLKNALQDPDRGPILSKKLLQSYPFSLVDEFQDTDSIQYSIFDSIYPKEGRKSGLMMIGDPKQAIYAFRGADIYTYFKAKKDGNPEGYSLNKNYRSSPRLIEAVNHLFEDHGRNTFIEDEIEFFKSEVGNEETGTEYLVDGKPPVPFKITMHPGLLTNKNEGKDFAYNQTVKQVAEILQNQSIQIKDSSSKKMRNLEAGDIAILVSGHHDAMQIKKRLKDIGVDSVTYSQEKVFDTFEAKRLELIMSAILEPNNRIRLNNALLSGLLGTDLNRLYQIKENESERDNLSNEFGELLDKWNRFGFLSMFYSLIYQEGRLDEISLLKNSERILTNLHQLADICSKAEIESNMDPHSLHSWFVKEMNSTRKDDEQTLLLESDQNLVKISTIHGSKGLEFPVVICSTLWDSRDPGKKEFNSYHKDNDNRLWINIDKVDTENRVEAERQHLVESIAEEVRKVYVALTRAKYECRVIWPTHNKSHLSGLGAALIGREKLLETASKTLKEIDDRFSYTMITNVLRELAITYPESFSLNVTADDLAHTQVVKLNSDKAEQMKAKEYCGRLELPVQNRVESFSSLAGHKSEAGEPDYDQITEWYVDARSGDREVLKDKSIFTFPKGALPGTVIHKLFEHDQFDFTTAGSTNLIPMIDEVLEEYGISTIWADVLQGMIRDVVGADYSSLSLQQVSLRDQLREMEFHFPVSSPNRDHLIEIIRQNRGTDPSKEFNKQFLTGFIDLIVRQNGKYYILDYKSNHLGDQTEDYSNDQLRIEIQAADYDLQYHLYTVALFRYLEKRIPEFDYESHFGGVMYLFVRGMKSGSSNGIWFHKPCQSIIEQLNQYLKRA